jgi:coproporphyrinogen III oxidase-like Fe-S oxidoreductase
VNVSNLGNFINIFKEGEHKDLVFPGGPATILMEPVNRSTQMKDFMMLGLRLIGEGVSEQRFQKSFNNPMGQVFRNEIAYLLAFDLVEWVAADLGRLRLTSRGVMVANQVFMQFI